MIGSDDHDQSHRTGPTPRPSLRAKINFSVLYQPVNLAPRVVHNHPSGDPTPSKADVEMTKTIAGIGAQMGIIVHDHIIIGKNGHASLKGMKLF